MTAVADWRSVRRRVMRRVFERGELEDTYGVVSLQRLDVAHPDRQDYEPSGWRSLARALRGHPIQPGDVFLDYGSGKGRVVQQAAALPFARVLGVEVSTELTAVARRNIEHNRTHLACGEVTLHCGDAAEFEVPDDVTHVYIFNPFVGPTFLAVLEHITRSHDRRPRTLTLIYGHPLMAGALAAHPRFALRRVVGRHRRIDRRHHIYTVLAPSKEHTP